MCSSYITPDICHTSSNLSLELEGDVEIKSEPESGDEDQSIIQNLNAIYENQIPTAHARPKSQTKEVEDEPMVTAYLQFLTSKMFFSVPTS